MTPRSLFLIVLKCLGIFFIKNFLLILPEFLSSFYFFSEPGGTKIAIWTLLTDITILAVYFLVIYYLLFKTDWIIEKFRLDKSFNEERFAFDIHRSSVLSIIIIITGLLIIIDAIPALCRQLFSYFREKQMTFGQTNPDIGKSIVVIAQLIIGLLLIGSQRQIINFIERKRRNTSLEGHDPGDVSV